MQVSPVDIQAWASETGADYPSTPAEKAAVLPAVAAWKREQLADAQAARGQNALATPLMVLGGVGLGLAGLAAYHQLTKAGHSPAAAAAAAQVVDQQQAAAPAAAPPAQGSGTAPPPAPQSAPTAQPAAPSVAVQDPAYPNPWDAPYVARAPRSKSAAAAPQQLQLPPSQEFAEQYAAAQSAKQRARDSYFRRKNNSSGALLGANRSGTNEARARGEYARTLWNDPALGPELAAADTPELQDALLTRLHAQDPDLAKLAAEALDARDGTYNIIEVKSLADLPKQGVATDGTVYRVADTGDLLVANNNPSRRDPNAPKGFQQASAAGVRYRLAPDGTTAYGSTTAQENENLKQTRRTGAGMFQPDFYLDKLYTYDDGTPIKDERLGVLRIETQDKALGAEMRAAAEEHIYNDRLQALQKKNRGATPEQLAAALELAGGRRIRDINLHSSAPQDLFPHRKPLRDEDGNIRRDERGRVLFESRKPEPRVPYTPDFWARPRPVFEAARPEDDVNLSSVLADKEDQDTKGLMEPLPASRSSYQGGYDIDRPSFVRVGNTLQPLEFIEIEQNYVKPDGSVGVRPVRFVKHLFVEEPVTQFQPNGKTKTRWNPNTEKYEQVALGVHQVVLGQDGKPVFQRRPAQYRDLFMYHSSEFADAPPYQGKTAAEAASAMPALPFDYSRAGRRIVTRDGRKIDVAPFSQNRFILHEADDSLSKALAAARDIDAGMPPEKALSRWGVDLSMVSRAQQWQASALDEGSRRVGPFVGTEGVGGRTSNDWLTQVLSAMQGEARPGAHKLALLEHGGTYEDSAALARGWLNANSGIAEVLSSNLGGINVQEQLNVVQEALADAAQDYPKAVQWAEQAFPELAERARLGGTGTFGFEHFQKSYVRKAVLGAAAELANAGGGQAASITLPAAISEVLMDEARQLNPDRPDIQTAINARIGGTSTPVEALWKLDGILSDAASDNLDESYTAGSKLAEQFFKAVQPGDGTRAGQMKARFGARTSSSYDKTIAPSSGEQVSSRLPIAINFGTNIGGAEGGNFNRNSQANVADEISRAVDGAGLTVWNDKSAIDPNLPKTRKQTSLLSRKTGGSARAFAVNSILDNEAKILTGQRYALRDSYQAGVIGDEELVAGEREIDAKLDAIISRQKRFDADRTSNELLIADANTQAQTEQGPEGRGYVLDLGQNGIVRALPNSGTTVMSYDQLFQRSDNESDDYFDAESLAASRRDAGSSGNAEAQFHDANGVLHEPVHAHPGSAIAAELARAEREGPMSDAEAAAPLQHLRYNQAIGRLRQRQQSVEAPQASSPAPARPAAADYTGEGPIGDIQRDVAAQLFPTPEQRAARSQAVQVARAYRPMANTLAASATDKPVGAVTQQEINDAHARHIGDWISKAATPRFSSAGAQIAGWTGGDSWHGGARLAGRANQNISPYTPASDAMAKALALAARRRAAV